MTIEQMLIFDPQRRDPDGLGVIFVEEPDADSVEEAVRSLAAQNREGVKLIRADGGFLAIGRGYHCQVAEADPPALFRLTGEGSTDANQDPEALSLESVLEAAMHYQANGDRKADLQWEPVG